MKNFNLNACGVSEISQKEMVGINGGNAIVGFLLGLLIAEILDRDASQDFEDGRQAARDFWGK